MIAMFDRFINIAKKLKQLEKEIPENELVKKLLRSLLKSWKPKVIAIKEAKNLNIISLDEVCDSLLTHEQEMTEDEEEEKKKNAGKRRSITADTHFCLGFNPNWSHFLRKFYMEVF
ncbi:hypothetical protein REPUB_Repub06bG0141700 [Reevesia pubescens]